MVNACLRQDGGDSARTHERYLCAVPHHHVRDRQGRLAWVLEHLVQPEKAKIGPFRKKYFCSRADGTGLKVRWEPVTSLHSKIISANVQPPFCDPRF